MLSSFLDTPVPAMDKPRNPNFPGFGFFAIGAAFLAVAGGGQPPFLGLGLAFIGVGAGLLSRSRKVG